MLKVLDTTTETEETPATPTLDDLAREGARRLLMAALQVEVAHSMWTPTRRLATRAGGGWWSVHGRGAEDLTYLQRGLTPVPVSAGRERPPGRAGGLPHDLVARGSSRLGGLGVVADRDGPAAHAPCPSIHPCPAGAGPCPGGGHDRDGPARQPADRRPPPGPARADPGGE